MPAAASACQKPAPFHPAGVSASLQLQLRQINNPLLKMKRFVQRATGRAVPECDTVMHSCSEPQVSTLMLKLCLIHMFAGDAQSQQVGVHLPDVTLHHIALPAGRLVPRIVRTNYSRRSGPCRQEQEVQFAHKNTKEDEASCCQMVTRHKDTVLRTPSGGLILCRGTAGEESSL